MLSCVGCMRATNQTVYSVCRRQLYSWSKPNLAPKTQYFTKHNIVSLATKPGRFYNALSVDQKARVVGYWLLGVCGLVATTVSVGGITRLTESGLSMTDWKFAGRRAPRNTEEWDVEFDKYKASPQWKYQVVHSGMTLNEFKFYLVYGVGTSSLRTSYWRVRSIPHSSLADTTLDQQYTEVEVTWVQWFGGVSGTVGWYMVKSGLEDHPESNDIPRVSQYRLASHLGSAFLLYLTMFKTSMQILFPVTHSQSPALQNLRRWSGGVAVFAFLTALSGAFVAGLDAGLVYNSYPKFADQWVPSDLIVFSPVWKNFFENTTTVQFDHRFLGHSLLIAICAVWVMSRPLVLPKRANIAANALMGMGWMQVVLGVSTLLLHVPTWLAATHQQGSLVLLTLATWLHHELGKKRIKMFKR